MIGQLNLPALWPYWPELLSGLWITIQLTLLATVGGVSLGITAQRQTQLAQPPVGHLC